MRRLLELALWVVLLVLPAGLAMWRAAESEEARVEQAFADTLGFDVPAGRSLSRAWFGVLSDGSWRKPFGVAAGWLVGSIALVVLVAAGAGLVPAAVSLALLVAHPVFWDLGGMATPWLPAAAFVLFGLAFLQGMVLPTLTLRRKSPRRWVPRLMAMTGCGLSLGLASSAEARLVWIVLVPGSLFILACVFAGLALLRLRRRRRPVSLLRSQGAFARRTLPFAAAWFLVVLLLWQVSAALEPPSTEALASLVPPAGSYERVCAWLALPGILGLGWREGVRLSFRSALAGSSVLLVCLAVLWLHGPALRADAGPLERLLGVSVFAASLGSLVRVDAASRRVSGSPLE